nr:putative cyclin-dependent serine/threonine-protein kinase DDB_G0272797/DDB_G0274007 [Cherax quadricarinatus]
MKIGQPMDVDVCDDTNTYIDDDLIEVKDVIESSRNREEEQRQEMQQEEELALLQNRQEDLLPQYEDHKEQPPQLQNMLCIKHDHSPPEHMQQEPQQPSPLQNVIYIKEEDSLGQDMQQDPLAQDVQQGEQPPLSHSIPDIKQEAPALQSVQEDHI